MRLFEHLSSYERPPFHKRGEKGEEFPLSGSWADGVRVVYDENTGLYWEVKSPNPEDVNYGGARFTFAQAGEVHVKALNDAGYGGFDDWRVPNKDELRSIFDYGRSGSVIDPGIFGACPVGDYWTKNIYRLQPYFSWVLFSGMGSGVAKRTDAENYVLAVRGGNDRRFGEPDLSRFHDNGDGTVTDEVTGLMWQKETNPRTGPRDADTACRQMTLAGYHDWRLPNIKELNTLLNLDPESGSWFFEDFFPIPPNEMMLHYSSCGVFEGHYAWVTNFTFGYDGYYGGRTAPLLFRAVRYADAEAASRGGDGPESTFTLTHTGQLSAFDLKGRSVAADRIRGLDAQRIWLAPSFESCEDGAAVLDRNTGLLWDNAHDGLLLEWADAAAFVRSLNDREYLGRRDWRLPGREELRSLARYDDAMPAIDTGVFSASSDYYWCSAECKDNTDLAWGFYFGYGCSYGRRKTIPSHVRAVSGKPDAFDIPSARRFTVNADNTVTDHVTGLMWMREETPLLPLKEALVYCEDLRLGGYDDWVLPNLKELATLVNLTEGADWFYPELFPETNTKPQGFYQSTTAFGGTFGWGCNFQFGFDGYYADRRNGKYPFRPVRRIR
ncbi:MAG: DUF1566 domain-containing protein [Eubacteriales bacterium]|nr:DUF1566 domain-containing protein [Eubacteriales bacterium]